MRSVELQHATLDSFRVNVTAYTTQVEYLHGHYVTETWAHQGSYTLNDEP